MVLEAIGYGICGLDNDRVYLRKISLSIEADLLQISYISHIVSQQSTRMEHFKGFRPRRGRTSHDRLRLVSNSRARLQELGIPNGHYLRVRS